MPRDFGKVGFRLVIVLLIICLFPALLITSAAMTQDCYLRWNPWLAYPLFYVMLFPLIVSICRRWQRTPIATQNAVTSSRRAPYASAPIMGAAIVMTMVLTLVVRAVNLLVILATSSTANEYHAIAGAARYEGDRGCHRYIRFYDPSIQRNLGVCAIRRDRVPIAPGDNILVSERVGPLGVVVDRLVREHP
jgi:hypothetical protein